MTATAERVLDWAPHYDERSRGYGVADVVQQRRTGPVAPPSTGKVWTRGPVLDQGREGACVGFGCAAEAVAEPVPVPGITDAWALAYYRDAQDNDQWPGRDYTGTSVLAGMLAGRDRGLWQAFRWAFSVEELAAAVVERGPAVIGVEWREGMYEAPGGVVVRSGIVVGGHCLCVIGYEPSVPELGGAPGFRWVNSWGPDYGDGGEAWVPLDVMRELVEAGGEFAIPEGRALPGKARRKRPATRVTTDEQTTAAEDDAPGDRTHHITARELQERDRITDGLVMLGSSVTVTGGPRVLQRGGEEVVRVDTTGGLFDITPGRELTVRRPTS